MAQKHTKKCKEGIDGTR